MAKENKSAELRKLEAQVGNLEVQNADYRQIIKELSDQLSLYKQISGSVFKKSRDSSNQNNSIFLLTKLYVFVIYYMHI